MNNINENQVSCWVPRVPSKQYEGQGVKEGFQKVLTNIEQKIYITRFSVQIVFHPLKDQVLGICLTSLARSQIYNTIRAITETYTNTHTFASFNNRWKCNICFSAQF